MSREEKIKMVSDYCKARRCGDCVLYSHYDHDDFDNMSDYTLDVCCNLINITENNIKSIEVKESKNSNIVALKVKGNCVDDLFHILANNGYPVQLSTTNTPNEYRVDVIIKSEVDNG